MHFALLSDWCQKGSKQSLPFLTSFTFYLQIAETKEPTSGLERLTCSLRVIIQVLQGFAQACKSPISKPLSFLYLALCCTVLRSRWCQSGVRSSWITRRPFLCARQASRNGDVQPAHLSQRAGRSQATPIRRQRAPQAPSPATQEANPRCR
jgi:hypothetical protein